MRVTCTKEHLVDQDDDDNMRYARVGDCGAVIPAPENGENCWIIAWDSGAWGFYSDEELARDTEEA